MRKNLHTQLSNIGTTVLKDEPMSKHTTFRIGGPADLFCIVDSSDKLVKVIKLCKENNTHFFLLGAGSNILVSDKGIRGVVIKNTSSALLVEDETVTVDSGFPMPKLAQETAKRGLGGCEFLSTIPGTIGGGILLNVRFRHPDGFGSYDGLSATSERDLYIGDLVENAQVLSEKGEVIELSSEECWFTHDRSISSKLEEGSYLILKVKLKLHRDSVEKINEIIRQYTLWRKNRAIKNDQNEIKQPSDEFTQSQTMQPTHPSAGCVFRNVPNKFDHPTGRLIDLCGLKGKRIRDAQISEKHANFIVNLGNAKASDVYKLIELCKSKVLDKFGIKLIEEVNLVGEF